jgi:flagellar biosynthesis anti-sigma factor FlgM
MGHKTLEKNKSKHKSETTSTNVETDEKLESLIDFYKQPEFIQMMSQQLAGQTNIDFAKIDKIKQAIANDSLEIDYKDLAEKIISFESELEAPKKQ